MNVRTKLRGGFAVYIALLAGLSVFHVRTTRRAVTTGRELAELASRLRTTSTVQLERVTQAASDAQKYVITHDTGYVARLQQTLVEYDADLHRLDSVALDTRERERLTPLENEWRRTLSLATALHAAPHDAVTRAADELQGSLDQVHMLTESLGEASQEAMSRKLAESERAATNAEHITEIAGVLAVLLSLLLSAVLAKSIVHPLGQLAEGTREVSAGRFSHRLTPTGTDEIAAVAREFNTMTERLDELDRMKSEFVSKVSHDLKTPLSSMQETNAVLLDEVAGPLTSKQRQLLDINQDSAARLAGMLAKLLDLSRIEAGVAGERQLTDVRSLLRHSVERIGENGSDERVVLPPTDTAPHLMVNADADGIAQVFDNLLENALKFSPFDGKVQVRALDLTARGSIPPERWAALRRADAVGAILVTVSDEGPGIPDAEKERIFARFYQAEAGRAVRRRGVGLGLSIVRQIVTDHGGAIWVGDNEPRGSVFYVLLPGKSWAVSESTNAQASNALAGDGVEKA
ncbi:MAG TPA: ATP-binding protein [Gemmatimonadaceae bacterium]